MRLALAVIGLASAVVFAQEFIPIGGGSGSAGGRPRVSPDFGETFTPAIIDPNDPTFQPANIAGNRPNPIPLFPKTQQAGTPHENPVDFTFVHQHSNKEPFRSDQFIGILHNPIGAARPNVPRTLGRENIYIDPRTIPNSALTQAEAERRSKNMMFFGLAPPVEKLHRADEFAPSTVPFRKPWDQWYDRFEEQPALPRQQAPLTDMKRPNIVKIPFYAADRGKRDAEVATEGHSTTTLQTTTDTAPTTTTILSDAIGSTTEIAALDTTTTAASAAVEATTSMRTVESTTTTTWILTTTTPSASANTTTSAPSTTTIAAPSSTPASNVSTTTTTAGVATPVNFTTTAAPQMAASLNGGVISVPAARRMLNDTHKPVTDNGTSATTSAPLPSSRPVPFRVHGRRRMNSTKAALQRLRNTKAQLRTTLASAQTTQAPDSRPLAHLKIDSALGSAKNASRAAATTKIPTHNTAFQKRPHGRSRVPLRRLFNTTTTTAAPSSAATTPASTADASTTKGNNGSTTTTTTTTTNATSATTAAPATTAVAHTAKAPNRVNSTTAARSKAPFRIFSKRPLVASKLPARTPIVEEAKPAAIESNSVGTLRTEVNRLLTTVVQLQSTVIAQQQRIALLENQLRLRRAAGRKPAGQKTMRFVAPNGRTIERTTVDIRKERSIKQRRGLVSQDTLRQRSNIA